MAENNNNNNNNNNEGGKKDNLRIENLSLNLQSDRL